MSPAARAFLRPVLFAAALALCACNRPAPPPASASVAELQRIDVRPGTGAIASAGSEVSVHYRGWVYDAKAPDHKGALIDDSYRRGQPLTFLLGAGRVIRGWDDGVAGMRVGGMRVLKVPYRLAYGPRGAGNAVPPYASLVFEVELVAVRPR